MLSCPGELRGVLLVVGGPVRFDLVGRKSLAADAIKDLVDLVEVFPHGLGAGLVLAIFYGTLLFFHFLN